ncbi:MAG: VOC family protein [Bacteroidetes bacterium]|nr:VOC family protein [Bacteroidota bacterium]
MLVATIELEGQEIILMNGGAGHPLTDAISMTASCESQEEVDYYRDKLFEGGKEITCSWLQNRFGLLFILMGYNKKRNARHSNSTARSQHPIIGARMNA